MAVPVIKTQEERDALLPSRVVKDANDDQPNAFGD